MAAKKGNLSKAQIQQILDRQFGDLRVVDDPHPAASVDTAGAGAAAGAARPRARLDYSKVKAKTRGGSSTRAAGAALDATAAPGPTASSGGAAADPLANLDDDDTQIITVVPKQATADAPGIGAKSMLISKSKNKVIAQQG